MEHERLIIVFTKAIKFPTFLILNFLMVRRDKREYSELQSNPHDHFSCTETIYNTTKWIGSISFKRPSPISAVSLVNAHGSIIHNHASFKQLLMEGPLPLRALYEGPFSLWLHHSSRRQLFSSPLVYPQVTIIPASSPECHNTAMIE